MTEEKVPLLSDFIPEKAKALLSGTGKDFVNRIGVTAIKKATAEVLCGENLRDQTEPLTRRRISQICGALVAMFANGWVAQQNFSSEMSKLAAHEMAAKRKAKTDGWPARWTLGLTDKLADNVLRGDAKLLPKYIKAFEEAISESANRCNEDCGPLTMQLSLPKKGKSTKELDWTEITRACFINRYGLKLGSLHEGFALMNFLYEQEAIGAVERCAVGADRAAAA